MGFVTSADFQISLLLFVSLFTYILATRYKQSPATFGIIAGVLLGPSFFNLIVYTDFVKGIAQIGAIFLLFVIGLECKPSNIYSAKAGLIALIGVIIPWIMGYVLAVQFDYPFVSAFFVGTSLAATSIAITAKVLKEMGRIKTQAAKAIIGAAVIDDILGLLMLSIASQIAVSEISIFNLALLAIKPLIFLIAGLGIGIFYINRQLKRLDIWAIDHRNPQLVFIATITIAFIYSIVAEVIGLSAIVGAFIAGISLENLKIESYSKDYKEGAEYLEIIFSSIFFISLGTLVNLKLVGNIGMFLALSIIVAIVSKMIGGFVSARLLGLGNIDSLTIGAGMVPRGEVAMIVALYGLSLGIIGHEIYTSILIMSLATTLITPFLLKKILKKTVTNGIKKDVLILEK